MRADPTTATDSRDTSEVSRAVELALDPAAQDLLFRQARSANTFTDEPVSDAAVRAIHDLVQYGPTSANGQPLRIVLLRTPEARARLLPLLSPGNQAKSGAAPLVAIFAADLRFHELLPRLHPDPPDLKERYEGGPEKNARRVNVARLNATLQIGYFLLGIRAAGLAAGPMGGFDAAGVNREFFRDGRREALVIVNIGRPGPDAWSERLPRLPYDDVVTSL